MTDSLLNLTLSWNLTGTAKNLHIADGIFVTNQHGLCLSHKNFQNILYTAENQTENILVVIAGSPIINGKVDGPSSAAFLSRSSNLKQAILSLNGEFLAFVWNGKAQRLDAFTDRFASYPIFWAQNENEFCLSYSYMDIVRHCRTWPGFALRPEKAYEFFMMQRLMGLENHDTLTHSMPPGGYLSLGVKGKARVERYWKPDYTKNNRSTRQELSNQFTGLFAQSVQIRQGTSSQKTGIFLSGGHDSRLVAAYANKPATCYTLSFSKNLEVTTAQTIAEITGHRHQFCKLAPGFFENVIDTTSELSAGLFTTDHALFVNAGMSPVPKADIFLHGHGLDFMYQGMYLHARYYELFGRHTYLKHFLPIPDNLPDHFINNISFRLKCDLRTHLLNHEKATPYEQSLAQTVTDIYKAAKALSDNPMDHLEYMIFHQPSKHYTFSNVLSKRTCGELRTPSFDNELYNFYLALPYRYRLHADMMRAAMYKANPKIARLPTANHALPAGWGPYSKTACLMLRKLLRHASLNTYFHVPSGADRTWPSRDDYFREHPDYLSQALSPLQDKDFKDFLTFIDWKKLENEHEQLMQQPLFGAFLVTLLSYYKFYLNVFR